MTTENKTAEGKTENKTARSIKPERDEELVRRYVGGEALEKLCAEFFISRSRVFQILKRAGVPRNRPPSSGRDQFLGVNLTEAVKDALRVEAERRGLSVSALSSDLLKEMLITCGYPLEAEKVSL